MDWDQILLIEESEPNTSMNNLPSKLLKREYKLRFKPWINRNIFASYENNMIRLLRLYQSSKKIIHFSVKITNPFSKIFEKAIYKRMYDFIDKNNSFMNDNLDFELSTLPCSN